MNTITVFHPQQPSINGGKTVFDGENVEYVLLEDGGLRVKNWVTPRETGHAVFASGQWAYVCHSRPVSVSATTNGGNDV